MVVAHARRRRNSEGAGTVRGGLTLVPEAWVFEWSAAQPALVGPSRWSAREVKPGARGGIRGDASAGGEGRHDRGITSRAGADVHGTPRVVDDFALAGGVAGHEVRDRTEPLFAGALELHQQERTCLDHNGRGRRRHLRRAPRRPAVPMARSPHCLPEEATPLEVVERRRVGASLVLVLRYLPMSWRELLVLEILPGADGYGARVFQALPHPARSL